MKTISLLNISVGLSVLASQAAFSIAIDVVGRVAWNTVLPDISRLPTDSKVLLRSSTLHEEFIRQDGTFVLHDVDPGRYILTVQCRTIVFPALSIQVPPSSNAALGHESPLIITPHTYGQAPPPPHDPGSSTSSEPRLQYPIQLNPIATIQYEKIKAGFNPIAMLLNNPMYLLMAAIGIFMMIIPKVLAQMDPEALAEVQANQANLHKQMSSIQNMDLASGFTKMLSASNEDEGTTGHSKISQSISTKSTSKSNPSTQPKRRK